MKDTPNPIPKRSGIDAVEIGHALEFVRRYYPSFWERVDEEDVIRLLLLGHTLFKSHPEILEANPNKAPTQ